MNNHEKVKDAYIDNGGSESDALPIFFIHSLGGNTKQWVEQLGFFRRSGRAIAVDLMGHGQLSAIDAADFSIEAQATWIISAMDKLRLEKICLVGHSMGGSVALEVAGRQPDRVGSLLLVDPSGDARQVPKQEIQPFLEMLESDAYAQVIEGYWQQNLVNGTDSTKETVLQDLKGTNPAAVVGGMKSLFDYDPLASLQRYDGPKLSIVTPLNDTPIGLHKLVDDLPMVEMVGTSHWLQMDQPNAFNRLLKEFVAQ